MPEPLHEGEEATDKGIEESEVTLIVYDKALEDRCMQKLEEELGKLTEEPQNVSYQFTITDFGVEGNIIKAVDTTTIEAKAIESTDILEDEWKNTYPR